MLVFINLKLCRILLISVKVNMNKSKLVIVDHQVKYCLDVPVDLINISSNEFIGRTVCAMYKCTGFSQKFEEDGECFVVGSTEHSSNIHTM